MPSHILICESIYTCILRTAIHGFVKQGKMADNTTAEQEPKSSQVSIRVTRAEKRAVMLVAAHRDVTEGDLLRDLTIDQIVVEYGKLFPDRAAVNQ